METADRQVETQLQEMQGLMRRMLDETLREGMVRAFPDTLEARRLVELQVRLLHRIQAIELAFREFEADLDRAHRIFDEAQRRAQEDDPLSAEAPRPRRVEVS